MRSSRIYLLASAAAISCCGLAESANAQVIYAGGATFPAPVYRQLFDCHSLQVDGNPPTGGPTGMLAAYPISPKCASATGDSSGLLAQILYAPVGSGAGKRGLINRDFTNNATGMGTPSAGNKVPYVSGYSTSYPYPGVQFIGSDDPWTAADAANYAASTGPAKFGNILQMPSLAGAVVIAFNGKDGNNAPLNFGAAPAGATADATTFGYPGAYSGLNLTRKAVCGIFTGHITQWNNPELTAANGGVPLGTGLITVVHRTDGSGTNFLFTNALYRQCQDVTGPNNETDPTIRSWEFRLADHSGAACPDVLYRASNTTDWPDVGAKDGCGVALNNNPGGGTFNGQSGNGGVVTKIMGQIGAIGYTTTDYTQPVLAAGAGPQIANIQSQYDVDNTTGTFQWASPITVKNTMNTTNPSFSTAAGIANPLNWSSQGQAPNPGTPNSYPIAGFTWLDIYQCYDPARSGGGTLSSLENYLNFHYYDSHAEQIMNSAGFAAIPSSWRNNLIPLLTGSSAIGTGGDPSVPGCKTRSGA